MTDSLLYFFDLFGTAIFAISGILLAGRLKMDTFGVIVLASVTAIGGGSIRDMMLGATPVFWITDNTYLWVIFITCFITLIVIRYLVKLPKRILSICDAIGLAVFVGIGVEKALQVQDSMMVAVIMGTLTGCGGGIIRDVLARQVPMVLKKEVYASACIIGGTIHTLSLTFGMSSDIAFLLGVSCTLSIRLAAIKWNLSLPIFRFR